jgi:hypothetical protein
MLLLLSVAAVRNKQCRQREYLDVQTACNSTSARIDRFVSFINHCAQPPRAAETLPLSAESSGMGVWHNFLCFFVARKRQRHCRSLSDRLLLAPRPDLA